MRDSPARSSAWPRDPADHGKGRWPGAVLMPGFMAAVPGRRVRSRSRKTSIRRRGERPSTAAAVRNERPGLGGPGIGSNGADAGRRLSLAYEAQELTKGKRFAIVRSRSRASAKAS